MAKADNEVYVKLRDKSTSFHDVSQNKNVVADRIVLMKRTALVSQALHHKVLDEVTEAEYDAYKSGEPAKKAAPVAEAKKVVAETTPAKKAAPVKKETAPKPEAKKKVDITDDDEDEDDAS